MPRASTRVPALPPMSNPREQRAYSDGFCAGRAGDAGKCPPDHKKERKHWSRGWRDGKTYRGKVLAGTAPTIGEMRKRTRMVARAIEWHAEQTEALKPVLLALVLRSGSYGVPA